METTVLTPYAPPANEAMGTVTAFTQVDAPLRIQYDLNATHVLGYDVWRVTEAFKFYVGDPKDNVWVYIPAGYLTDGATVPRLFWDLIPPWGSYGQAAVVHDILCEYLTVFKDGVAQPITRREADSMLNDAMKALSVPAVTRWLIYAGVKFYTYIDHKTKPDATLRKRMLENAWVNTPSTSGTTP